MGAGDLDTRISFEQQALNDDAERLGPWTLEFSRNAHVLYQRGGEGVLAMRMSQRQPAIVTVRKDPDTERITTDWRGYLADAPATTFAVRGVAPARQRGFLEVTVEFGANG